MRPPCYDMRETLPGDCGPLSCNYNVYNTWMQWCYLGLWIRMVPLLGCLVEKRKKRGKSPSQIWQAVSTNFLQGFKRSRTSWDAEGPTLERWENNPIVPSNPFLEISPLFNPLLYRKHCCLMKNKTCGGACRRTFSNVEEWKTYQFIIKTCENLHACGRWLSNRQ